MVRSETLCQNRVLPTMRRSRRAVSTISSVGNNGNGCRIQVIVRSGASAAAQCCQIELLVADWAVLQSKQLQNFRNWLLIVDWVT